MGWTYNDFVEAILTLTNIDLASYKERQMKRRIDSLISREGYNEYSQYFAAISNDELLLQRFLNYLTINVSEFYRNIKQWKVLETDIIPLLLSQHKSMKIWSAACSTGEEAYSMVMLLTKFANLNAVKILATDIDEEALKKAMEGVYSAKSVENVPDEFLKKYFHKYGDNYAIDDKIKSCVDFKHHDLLMDSFPSNCHLILCRNVMIYFTEDAKSRLYSKFYNALHDDGILFVGSTEQIILPQRYSFCPFRAFFYKRINN